MFPHLKQHFLSGSFLRLKGMWSLIYLLDATMCQYRGTFSLKIHGAPVPRADPVRFQGAGAALWATAAGLIYRRSEVNVEFHRL